MAAVFAPSAATLAFTDDSCDDTKPCRPPEGMVGTPYRHELKAMPNTGNGPPYSFGVINGALPPGLTLSSDGPITGTPTQAGGAQFWVELSDKPTPPENWCVTRHSCAQRSFSIGIIAALSITTQSATPATRGSPYSLPLSAMLVTNINPPAGSTATNVTWSIISGQLPQGLALVSGAITGMPTQAGSFSVGVQAVLDERRRDTETLSIVVREPLVIAPPAFPASEVSVPFRAEVDVSGGIEAAARVSPFALTLGRSAAAAYTLTVTGLPPGLVADAAGIITGTPAAAGTFPVTINAADIEGRTATLGARLTVAPKLAITTKRLAAAKAGRPYRVVIKTRGGVGPLKWGKLTGRLPVGIRFDRRTGVLSGTAKKAGRYTVTVKVTDALKVTTERVLSFTLKGVVKPKAKTSS